ncbi:MAG: ABC transporter ATP-binding protein [Eubacterium sp.]
MKLLEVKDLKTYFYTEEGVVKSVDGVSFSVDKGKTLGVVGESGCGKSITSLSIMQLVETPPGKIVGGEIIFKGENLLEKDKEEMRKIRGKEIAMIFQEPMTSLNPVYTVGDQIMEAVLIHEDVTKEQARQRAIEMMDLVKIPDAEKRLNAYPHEFSGGMRQRVMIAMALSCNPEFLICDEPTTALDVTIQAQILNLINELKDKMHTSVMMITHDLGVIAEVADDVMIMYAGQVVEYADVQTIFEKPLHPYTVGLLNCIPRIDGSSEKLATIKGMVPSSNDMPEGCLFCPRCEEAKAICHEKRPGIVNIDGHQVRCFKYTKEWGEES